MTFIMCLSSEKHVLIIMQLTTNSKYHIQFVPKKIQNIIQLNITIHLIYFF
jgi:hypothetical protein